MSNGKEIQIQYQADKILFYSCYAEMPWMIADT